MDATSQYIEVENSTHQGSARDIFALIVRLGMGAFFIYMGLQKALHPEDFLKLIRQYDLVSTPWLLNCIAATLPWFEVFCGLLLMAGIAVRAAALTLAAMLIPFTVLVIKRALGIAAVKAIPFCAVKFDCGCGAGEVFICNKIIENTVFLLLSIWLVAGPARRFCLRFSLFSRGKK